MALRLLFIKNKQGELLKKFLSINHKSVSEVADNLRIGKTTLKQWVSERRTLPSDIFITICETTPQLKSYENYVVARLPENWGRIKGGISRIRKIKNLDEYLSNVRKAKQIKRLKAAIALKSKIKTIDRTLQAMNNDKANLKYILATCLLTDGSLTKDGSSYRISYYTIDLVLKKLVKSLLIATSKFVPTIAYKKGSYIIRVSDNDLAKELLTLSPSYKKTPRNDQGLSNYLAERQPSLAFLGKADSNTIKWCIRLAFAAEGSISISKNKTIELNLACYHPVLAKEWLEIFGKNGLNGHLGKEKTSWSGIDGVRIYDLNSLKNFWDIGGFLDGVKVTGKSKRYKGIEKNVLLERAIRARSLPALSRKARG